MKLKTEERKSIMRIEFCGYLRKNAATMAGPHYRALIPCERYSINTINGGRELEGEENFILIVIFHTKLKIQSSVAIVHIAPISS